MTPLFPTTSEIRLAYPPLEDVICQVKFAKILRISKEKPVDFQEAIRDHFPGYQFEQPVVLFMPGQDDENKQTMEVQGGLNRFLSLDEKTQVSLASDFFAISTQSYTHWEDFLTSVKQIQEVAKQIYKPAFFTRTGLRFINRFTRKNTGCKNREELLSLFREELTCLVRSNNWLESVEMLTQMVLTDGEAKLSLRTGFNTQDNEPFFLLDFDYFEEGQIPPEDLITRLEHYHGRIHDAFRWCLLDESLKHFGPLS